MGCLCPSNHSALTTEEEIKSMKLKNEAYEATLTQNSSTCITGINLSLGHSDILYEEQIRNQKVIKNLFHYLGIDDISPEEIEKKFQEFIEYDTINSQYSLDREKVCNQLINVASILKQIDNKKAQHIKSKIQVLENLLQNQYENLVEMINTVKEKEMVHSSSIGGTIEQILARLHSRSELDKELEIIQTKLEYEQYLQILRAKDDQIKQFQLKIKELNNEKNDIERSWELVKMSIKTDPEELKVVQNELEKKEKELALVKKRFEEVEAQKAKVSASKMVINGIQNKIYEQEIIIAKENGQIETFNKHNEELASKINEIPDLEKQIEKLIVTNKEKEDQAAKMEELYGVNSKAIIDAAEKMNVEINHKETRIAEISASAEKVKENIRILQLKRKADMKKRVVIKLSYALKKLPDLCIQRWKWITFNKSQPKAKKPKIPSKPI